MFQKKQLLRSISAICASGLALSFNANAQSIEPMEEIIVTGSYIKGSPEDAASPVQVIDREDMNIQSAMTVEDITRNLTVNAATTTNFNFDTENSTLAGKANINLRGLGVNSTLVLFNGKRQVVAAAETQDGSEFVDINTIPMVMLERVEILKDGGSAIYGSDAIAGVVNFILRDDFEGFQFSGDITNTEEVNRNEYTLSGIWGTSFNEGRSNFVIGGEYFQREGFTVGDLGFVNSRERVTETVNEISNVIPGPFSPLNPAYLNQEITAITGTPRFTDPLCEQQGYFTGLFSDPANEPNQFCREDTRGFRQVQVDEDRYSLMASFTHQFSEAAEFYAMVQYFDQTVERLDDGTQASIANLHAYLPVGDPWWGLGSRAPAVATTFNTAFVSALGMGFDAQTSLFLAGGQSAPLMNTPANAPILTANGGPGSLTTLNSQPSQRGDYTFNPDVQTNESSTTGITAGLKGDFEALGGRAMTYDVSVAYGQTETYRTELTVNRTRLELANNGLGGPNCTPNGVDDYNLNADPFWGGSLGFAFINVAPGYVLNTRRNISLALTSTNQGVGGCQFFNPFLTRETGQVANDPELLNWIYQTVPLEDRENEQLVFDFVLTSELFEMGGGMAMGAFGYQHRDQSFVGRAYPEVVPGLQDYLTYDNPATPENEESFLYVSDDNFYGAFTRQFDNERTVDAVFAEVQLPITSNFDLQLAVRWEDYGGNIGAATTPKIGARWQIVDQLVVRSSYSQAFRAPNTGILFKGVGFDGQAANDLLARQEVRAGLLPPTEDNALVRGIIQAGQPSPNVGNEEAETFNIGAIWNPTDSLTLMVDYYYFDFRDRVVNQPVDATLATELANFEAAAADPNNYINQQTFLPCVQNGSDPSCVVNPAAYATTGVQRAPDGLLQVVDFQNVNAGQIETSGVDIGGTYTIDSSLGLWTLGVNWTHTIEFTPSDIPGFENGILGLGVTDAAGTTGDGSVARSMPQDRINTTLNFSNNNHSATAIVRYISGYDNLGAVQFNSSANPPKTRFNESIDSWTTVDLQYAYTFEWGANNNPLMLTFGIVNAIDEDPPARDDFALGYDTTIFDPRGRRFFFRATQTF